MRVLVTGGTGYVGAHAVAALLRSGHAPRLLVRDPARLHATVAAIGVDLGDIEVAPGDMTDADAVKSAVAGVEAVIHGAAVVAALNQGDARRALETNVKGAEIVIDAALAAGCDPVVHISSVAAVFTPAEPLITSTLAPATGATSPYTRSKALAEVFARKRQAEGAPVTIVYPGGVAGPAAGSAYGDVAEGFVSMLKPGMVPLRDGALTIIDVRDLAAVLVATLQPGLGPRRFVAGGELVDLHEVARLLRATTGRRIPVVPLPGAAFRGLGRLMDAGRRLVPIDTVYTAEAMDLLTRARPTDDSAVHDELGVTYRPVAETVEALVRALYDGGRLNAKQVGIIARHRHRHRTQIFALVAKSATTRRKTGHEGEDQPG